MGLVRSFSVAKWSRDRSRIRQCDHGIIFAIALIGYVRTLAMLEANVVNAKVLDRGRHVKQSTDRDVSAPHHAVRLNLGLIRHTCHVLYR